MKKINNYIQEKLIINKDSKLQEKQKYDFDEFKELFTNTLNTDYQLTNEDFRTLKNQYLESHQSLNECKFIDITNDTEELNYYINRVSKVDKSTFSIHYIIQQLIKGIFFHYNNINTYRSIDNGYRMGFILGTINDRSNKNNVKIFKVKI